MGFYADVDANCKIYHTCDDHGNKFTYRCPEETAFRQDASICDHAYLVDCQATIYPAQFPNENIDKDIAHTAFSTSSPAESINSLDDHQLSFSRSFRVIQRPNKSMPNKFQSSFFTASIFLKNQDRTRNQARQITDTCTTCNANSRNRIAVSTARTLTKQFDSWNPRNDKSTAPRQSLSSSETRDKSTVHLNRSYEPLTNSSPAKAITSVDNQYSSPPREKSPSSYNSDFHSYSETLRSIQASAHTAYVKSTTEIPVHALTLSLKPLIPNELEYDPYYPKQPTSTEAYYTPSNRNKIDTNTRFSSSSQAPLIVGHANLPFQIPPVLPDLNALEDLVDRRKFFYIPRTNVKSI